MIPKRRGFVFLLAIAVITVLWIQVSAATDADDLQALQNFQKGVASGNALSSWTGTDPCGSNWKHIQCTGSSVTGLLFQSLSLGGTVTPDIQKMKNLETIQFQNNGFTGSLPSLSGLSKLKIAYFVRNSFDTIPGDFFDGLVSLTEIDLDDNPMNGSAGWSLPSGIQESVLLDTLSLGNTSLSGSLPDFLGNMTSLKTLKVSYNMLSGGIPSSFASSGLEHFIANNQQGSAPLSGDISVVGKMTSLQTLWLHVNQFSGSIPSTLSNCLSLQELKLNDNKLVGRIPSSLTSLSSLKILYVRNNDLVGMIPAFPSWVNLTLDGNNFCQSTPGIPCAPDVTSLLDFHEAVGYNSKLTNWQLNDPCSWTGISCGSGTNVTIINLPNFGLAGTISSSLGNLTSLTTLILKNNKLSGQIPNELTKLPNLKTVDLSGNQLSGPYPSFSNGVNVNVSNNDPANASSPSASPSTPASVTNSSTNGGSSSGNGTNTSSSKSSSSNTGIIVGMIVAVVVIAIIAVILWFTIFRKKSRGFLRVQSPNTVVVHPRDSGSDPEVVKIVVAGAGNPGNESETQSRTHSGPSEVQVVEAGNLLISIQVLREATKNFSEHSILGRGGFGVVYKGVLDDGTTIAVKRMEAAVVSSKGLNEFQAEIAVLTKVRHRHLVALLGYCIEGNERLLVYEYMPQGTLSQHVFEYVKNGWKPLNWKQRLSIALDVARGMEYLHSLAHKSFIHRDLKPSNILLGDDLHAKVSDFGLVKLAPEGKFSVETRLAGTFGYLAPEYAVTGRVTTKADVFSFGVVLMELITGRRALDETQAEENMHLVAWFRRMSNNKENFRKSIDPAIELNEETLPSITTVAELAGHCTAREPYQRPEMGHAVNILSPLVEKWKPADYDTDENAGIDLDMTLPQALKRWQELDNSYCLDDTQASLPPRPSGFPESFTSEDAR